MSRPIDHLVLAAHDLSLQAAFYRRLGFQVGSRNQHPWGTENHITQLDGGFLELIALGKGFSAPVDRDPRVFSFAGFLDQFLRRRQGFAMLVLRSQDARRDRIEFRHADIGDFEPFSFGRKAKRPDGSEAEVAFTLVFAQSAAIDAAGLFVRQHHFPENFWNRAFQQHDNTAKCIAAATMVAPGPEDHVGFLQAFAGSTIVRTIASGVAIDTGGGRINVVTAAGFRTLYGKAAAIEAKEPFLAALEIGVADLTRLSSIMRQSGVAFARHRDRLVVAADAAFGCVLAFVG